MPRIARLGKPPASTNAGRRFPPEVLTDAEVLALMDACGEGLPSCARNRALIAVLYRGGLRVSEALALYPKDLDPATGAVRVLWGKGGRVRVEPGDAAGTAGWHRTRATEVRLLWAAPRYSRAPGGTEVATPISVARRSILDATPPGNGRFQVARVSTLIRAIAHWLRQRRMSLSRSNRLRS